MMQIISTCVQVKLIYVQVKLMAICTSKMITKEITVLIYN